MVMTKATDTTKLVMGHRKITKMNYSNVCSVPRTWVDNYLTSNRDVELVMESNGNLTLIPISAGKTGIKK